MRKIRWLFFFCLSALLLLAFASQLAEASARNRAFLGLAYLLAQPQLAPSAGQVEPIVTAFRGAGVKQTLGEGILAMFAGNCDLAIPHFQAYLHSHPTDTITPYWIGNCFARDGDWESAIRIWQASGLVRPLKDSGNLLAGEQKWELARQAFRAVLALTPDDCVYQARAASAAWWAERDTLNVSGQLEHIIASCPDTMEGYIVFGRILTEDKQFDRAQVYLEKAHELAPDSDRPLTTLALLYLRQQRPAEALPLLQKADRMDPNDPSILVLLGSAYADLGQAVSAIGAFENAIRLGTQEAWVYEVLGLMYERTSRKEEARAAYQRALELDPNRETARARLAKLED